MCPVCVISILSLSSFLVVSFFSFALKISYAYLISPTNAIYPAQPIHLEFIIAIMFTEEYNLWSSSCYSCSLLLLPPSQVQIFSLASCTLCSSLNSRDQVSHAHKTTGKIIIKIFLFLDNRWQYRKAWTEWQHEFYTFNLLSNTVHEYSFD